MRPLPTAGTLLLAITMVTGAAAAQEARLAGRLSPAARADVEAVLDSARRDGLPVEPLVDRALEGATKGADDARMPFLELFDQWSGDSSPGEVGFGADVDRAVQFAERLVRPGLELLIAEEELDVDHEVGRRGRPHRDHQAALLAARHHVGDEVVRGRGPVDKGAGSSVERLRSRCDAFRRDHLEAARLRADDDDSTASGDQGLRYGPKEQGTPDLGLRQRTEQLERRQAPLERAREQRTGATNLLVQQAFFLVIGDP